VIHDLADLLGEGARQRAAVHREVLREHEYKPTVDAARAGDHAVAEDLAVAGLEVHGPVDLEAVELGERAGIEQQLDALARGQLAALVLSVDARLAAAELGLGVQLFELLELVLERTQDQYSFWAWSTLIALRLMMSSTVAVGVV
jgi:hypothetical protein